MAVEQGKAYDTRVHAVHDVARAQWARPWEMLVVTATHRHRGLAGSGRFWDYGTDGRGIEFSELDLS